MGKRIIQQARGKGSLRYKIRKQAFRIKFSYPDKKEEGEGEIIKLFNSVGYSTPIAKIKFKNKIFHNHLVQQRSFP